MQCALGMAAACAEQRCSRHRRHQSIQELNLSGTTCREALPHQVARCMRRLLSFWLSQLRRCFFHAGVCSGSAAVLKPMTQL